MVLVLEQLVFVEQQRRKKKVSKKWCDFWWFL